MKKIIYFAVFFLVIATGTVTHAEERVDLEGATIIGNRELPKILYVVPWKLPDRGHIISRPVTRRIDADLDPIDITSFERFLELHTLRLDKNQ